MQMQRENAKQYIILREFYLQQMRIFVTQNRMDLTIFGYATSQNRPKIYQKFIRRRVRAVLTQQIFLSPKAFLAGHIGNMSKRKDAGIGEICTSKPTWFGSRSAMRFIRYHESNSCLCSIKKSKYLRTLGNSVHLHTDAGYSSRL